MTLETTISELTSKATSFLSLSNFVQKELSKFLVRLGDLDIVAGLKALENSNISNNPKRELEICINCLLLAQTKYESIIQEGVNLNGFQEFLRSITFCIYDPITPALKAVEKNIITSCILAVTYSYLNENQLKEKYLSSLSKSLEQFREIGLSSIYNTASANVNPAGMRMAEQNASDFKNKFQNVKNNIESLKIALR